MAANTTHVIGNIFRWYWLFKRMLHVIGGRFSMKGITIAMYITLIIS